MTEETTREEINRLLAKVYAELANDLLTNTNDGKGSKIWALHENQVNRYFSADVAEKPALAVLVVDAFANVLPDPTDSQKLKEWFQARKCEGNFADAMASIFRCSTHKAIRPYEPPFALGTDDSVQNLGW